ncbi:hypothetical protein BOTBODRAFT_59955 [Botryobasidium botryosum FD-172 SS1]|uniref:CASTOR ACT domain-containing protein n=1 Tax=Botryobasidium botryosum (strain FD-172 SS1) TaxID=930990 RepID=A0A067M6F9_BOTB1|nr:hypothetical protein BOTBODRAFT_59955 [Botryobasidium botryosum FD-172 SS1]
MLHILNMSATVLNSPCLLVQIPSSRVQQLSHHITKQFFTPHPDFLSITTNDVDGLSIFAEEHTLTELKQVAKQDRARLRRGKRHFEPIQVSPDRWHVLVLESHEDVVEEAGARIQEISAPLARAGIPIFYQSSHLADNLLVQSERLAETLALFRSMGLTIYVDESSEPTPYLSSRRNTSLTSLASSNPRASSSTRNPRFYLEGDHDVHSFADQGEQGGEAEGIRLPQSISVSAHNALGLGIELPPTASSLIPPSPLSPSLLSLSSPALSTLTKHTLRPPTSTSSPPQFPPPLCQPASFLEPDFAMVGLNKEYADIWMSKVIKLLLFPELVVTKARRGRSSSIVSDANGEKNGREESSDSCSEDSFSGDELSGFSSNSPHSSSHTSPDSNADTTSSCPPNSNEDGAHQSPRSHPRSHRRPMQFLSFIRTSEGTSLLTDVYQLAALFPPQERYMLHCADELEAIDREEERERALEAAREKAARAAKRYLRKASGRRRKTNESAENGSGATPPTENSMAQRRNSAPGSGPVAIDADAASLGLNDGGEEYSSTFKVLQIDLREFGLDVHGIVSRFSDLLQSHGINHFFTSTFKSANILVSQQNAMRAYSVLCDS